MKGKMGTTTQLFPVQQAFASEKAFGVLSETLYELLQLVSESPPSTSPGAMPGKVLSP